MTPPRSSTKPKAEIVLENPQTGRELALLALEENRLRETFLKDSLKNLFRRFEISSNEKPLATELAFGTLRRRMTLDTMLKTHLDRPLTSIEEPLLALFRMGVYQLVFCERIPVHAALNETVQLAKRIHKPRWCSFLNGVLRNVARNLTDVLVTRPAADAIPVRQEKYRKYQQSIFPNPDENCVGYFSQAFSYPNWLVERWATRFSSSELSTILFGFNEPSPLTLRNNRLKQSRDEFLELLNSEKIDAAKGEAEESVKLLSSQPVETLPGFAEGRFSVQDETAMQAVLLLDPKPGESILDLCAAPGGKTTFLAESMQNKGNILATDVSEKRLELIDRNLERLGIAIVETKAIHKDGSDFPTGPFDAVLLDVPCSNTGVLGKRPETRWRIQPRDIQELVEIQRRLCLQAMKFVRPGGRLVYSTCSIEPEEDEQTIRTVLDQNPNWKLKRELHHRPGQPADGGYQALCAKIS